MKTIEKLNKDGKTVQVNLAEVSDLKHVLRKAGVFEEFFMTLTGRILSYYGDRLGTDRFSVGDIFKGCLEVKAIPPRNILTFTILTWINPVKDQYNWNRWKEIELTWREFCHENKIKGWTEESSRL